MNLGMLVGFGFGYAMFDKNGKKIVKKAMDKITKAGQEILKNMDKEGEKSELQRDESE